jgi:hypothetical protein
MTKELSREEKDNKTKKLLELYDDVKGLFKEYKIDMTDYTTLLSMLTVDFIEILGQIDNIPDFMDEYKILIINQARVKRGYN